MNSDIQMILNFVEGKISSQEFESYLYESKTIQTLLEQEKGYTSYNLYYDLLEINFKTLTGSLNAQGYLEKFLTKLNINFKATDQYRSCNNLILSASPSWLDVDPVFVQKHFLNANPSATKKELRTWLLSKFKYMKSTPKWVQYCDWPIKNEEPLVFIGQIEVNGEGYFHDITVFYLFFNPKTRECETVIQSY